MIDLGRWSSEDYRVPLAETPEGLATDFDRELSSSEDYRVPLAETPEGLNTDFDREFSSDEQT